MHAAHLERIVVVAKHRQDIPDCCVQQSVVMSKGFCRLEFKASSCVDIELDDN